MATKIKEVMELLSLPRVIEILSTSKDYMDYTKRCYEEFARSDTGLTSFANFRDQTYKGFEMVGKRLKAIEDQLGLSEPNRFAEMGVPDKDGKVVPKVEVRVNSQLVIRVKYLIDFLDSRINEPFESLCPTSQEGVHTSVSIQNGTVIGIRELTRKVKGALVSENDK